MENNTNENSPNFVNTKQQPRNDKQHGPRHIFCFFDNGKRHCEQPHRQCAQRVPRVIERHGRLVDAFGTTNALGQVIHMMQQGQSLAIEKIGLIGHTKAI